MKNTTIFVIATLVALIVVTGISGCKKEDDDTSKKAGVTPKIKTLSYYDPWSLATRTETYAYDAQGRVTTVTTSFSDGSSGSVVSYSYGTNYMTETRPGIGPKTYALNSDGYVSDYFLGTQTYDADGHVTSDGTHTYTWANGNLISSTNDPSGSLTFTYHTDKTNTIGNDNKGMSFFGKESKNLINTSTNGSGTVLVYSHEYDSQGRVTKETGKYGYAYNYTYF